MFPDAFVPNLLVFALGQMAACGYLRTGLVTRGVWLLVLTWLFADVALVLRFAYGDTGLSYVVALIAMQFVAVMSFCVFVTARIRRRLPRVRARRETLMREAFVQYLRDDLTGARESYRRLLRTDPWDAATRLGLGTVLLREGASARGRRMLRSARGVDTDAQFRDAVDAELERTRVPANVGA